MKFLLSILFAVHLTAFNVFAQADNKKPMYGEVPKTEAQKTTDQSFISSALAQHGSKEKASAAYVTLGWKYFYHDSLVTAMKRFNQAWLLNAENPDSYFGFAALTELSENASGSERFYIMGYEKDKDKTRAPQCLQRIADCKEHLNDIKGTIKAYQTLVAIDPANAFAYKKLGFLYSAIGKNDESLSSYSNAIQLDSTDQLTYTNRGFQYYEMKLYAKAIADYTRAIQLDPNYISAYVNRGICHMDLKNFEGAKNDFKKSTELDPSAGELFRLLGSAKIQLKDTKGACTDFESAKKAGDAQAKEWILKYCK